MERSAPAPKTGPELAWWAMANIFFFTSKRAGMAWCWSELLPSVKRKAASEGAYRPRPLPSPRLQATSLKPPLRCPWEPRTSVKVGVTPSQCAWKASAEKSWADARKTHLHCCFGWPYHRFSVCSFSSEVLRSSSVSSLELWKKCCCCCCCGCCCWCGCWCWCCCWWWRWCTVCLIDDKGESLAWTRLLLTASPLKWPPFFPLAAAAERAANRYRSSDSSMGTTPMGSNSSAKTWLSISRTRMWSITPESWSLTMPSSIADHFWKDDWMPEWVKQKTSLTMSIQLQFQVTYQSDVVPTWEHFEKCRLRSVKTKHWKKTDMEKIKPMKTIHKLT